MRWLRRLAGIALVAVIGCGGAPAASAVVLLYNGHGTSPDDVSALESILRERGIGYSTLSTRQLEAMSEADLSRSRLLLVPGGNFETLGNALSVGASSKVRNAVAHGLGYLGVCAGAFFAGASPYNGLNLTSGVRFPFYAIENQGVRKAPVTITPADGTPVEVYWEDGPQLTGWGEVVAKYPDGTPAVAQGRFGAGSVVLLGVHPEAPERWRRGLNFTAPAAESRAYAAAIIDAAVNHRRFPHE